MKYDHDNDRFTNTTGRVRWAISEDNPDKRTLQQQMYANFDINGNYLQYPETKWLPVPIVVLTNPQ